MGKRYYSIDDETAEIEKLGYGRFISAEQDHAIRKRKARSAGEEQQGDFVWALFQYCGELFPDLGCTAIARLFYLATFVEYDGDRLTADGGYTFLNKRQIKSKLMAKDTSFSEFWNEMINKNILSVNEKGNVLINTSLFRKGEIDKRCKKDFIRLYCDCIRYLYENTSNAKDQAKLAYVFKIIPFVNRRTNIVCYNPTEMDTSKINPMSFGDVCELIGYRRSNASRLFKDLLKFKIKDKHLLCYVSLENYSVTSAFVIINPNIYYGGAEQSDAKFLFDICDRKMEDS